MAAGVGLYRKWKGGGFSSGGGTEAWASRVFGGVFFFSGPKFPPSLSLRIHSCESIHANSPDSRCESLDLKHLVMALCRNFRPWHLRLQIYRKAGLRAAHFKQNAHKQTESRANTELHMQANAGKYDRCNFGPRDTFPSPTPHTPQRCSLRNVPKPSPPAKTFPRKRLDPLAPRSGTKKRGF